MQNARWLAHLGDKAYDFAIQMNRFVNFFRRLFGVPYWSLSQWAKQKVKNAVNYIGAFEAALAAEARRHGADGVICGHIHYAVDPRRPWRPLHELRRLGGELHGARRARGWPFRDHHLERSGAARSGSGAAQVAAPRGLRIPPDRRILPGCGDAHKTS